MNPTLNERMKQIGRILIYIILVIFLIRNVIDVVDQFTSSDAPPPKQQESVSADVPDTAKSVAKLFLENWYSITPNQNDDDRLETLKPFVTTELSSFISAKSDLSIDSSFTPNTNSNNTNSNGQQETEFQGVNAKEVDIWKATWQEKSTGKAEITARLLTSEDKVLFLSLPVEKSGTTWQVSALPSLVAEPKGLEEEPADPPDIGIADKKEAITTMLDSFFSGWLAGNSEVIKRYMADGKVIDTTNWLETLNGEYKGVQDIIPVSDNPLKVKVVIMVRDGNGVNMLLNYFITLEQRKDQWYIVSID